ncbi:MAG TPA: hypothetical protein DCF68_16925 [Cyanothece sp. UBA12306]|nr:hypothetical protein [Cyanothece sp. UBA12306]
MTVSNQIILNQNIITSDVFQVFLFDEDGQNVLGIDEGNLKQSLTIELVNTSGKNIELQTISDEISSNNYHFCFLFRPGTILPDSLNEITLKQSTEGWKLQQQDHTFYCLLTANASQNRTIAPGAKITLTLENISAAPEGGSRGTRVQIKYNYLNYQGSNEDLSGNRLQYLNIVNQRGKKTVPLHVSCLGSNTILNDGTENELTLSISYLYNGRLPLKIASEQDIQETLTNLNLTENLKLTSLEEMTEINGETSIMSLHEMKEMSQEKLDSMIGNLLVVTADKNKPVEGNLKLKGIKEGFLDQATRLSISFDVAQENNDAANWALIEANNADDVNISIMAGQDHWLFDGRHDLGLTPQWHFICKNAWQAVEAKEILRLKISNFKTLLKAGFANLYVRYENVPGYWDGQIIVPIHKGPLVYREMTNEIGSVGIGTDEPKAKLHIKQKEDNHAAIFEGGNVGIGTTTPEATLHLNINNSQSEDSILLGNTDSKGLRLRDTGGAVDIESLGVPLYINNSGQNTLINSENAGNVGIGTTDPGDNKLKIQGKTEIAGNLSVTNGLVGIGSANLSKEPLVIRARERQESLIAFEDPQGRKKWHIEQNYGGNKPGLNFVETGVKDFRLFIGKGGNVGIGTGNPSDKLHIKGSLRVDGNLKIQGTEPIIIRRYNNLGDSINYNTNCSASTYTAAIIGFRALNGDIKENDTGNIIQVYMYINSGIWYIRADFRTHKNNETWYVDVMFIRNELVKRIGY